MGSFIGHIDESIFFILIAFWWMINVIPKYINSIKYSSKFQTSVSYRLPGKHNIPLEAILKLLFPIGGFIGEICSEGYSLYDKDGNFRKLSGMQHMSIYGIFAVHGLVDVLMRYHFPLPKNLDYLTGVAAFFWYGNSFSYHSHMHGKDELESMIHILPIPIIYATAIAGFLEMLMPNRFDFILCRIFCLLVLGTWFTQAAFVMYLPGWPGSQLNPVWDRQDEKNVHAIVAIFGYHLILALLVVIVSYSVIYLVMKSANRSKCEKNAETSCNNADLKEPLLFQS